MRSSSEAPGALSFGMPMNASASCHVIAVVRGCSRAPAFATSEVIDAAYSCTTATEKIEQTPEETAQATRSRRVVGAVAREAMA